MLALSSHAEIDMPPVRRTDDSPEKHLMSALISDAVTTIRDHGYSKSRLKRGMAKEAVDWIMSDEPQDAGLSFERCCLGLGLDKEWMRKQILNGAASPIRKHRGYR